MTEIKTIEKAELTEVLELDGEIFYPQEYNLRTIRQMFDIASDYFLIARSGEKLAGYCLGATTGKTGWILTVAVDANFRGTGIGKKLTVECIERFRLAVFSEIKLTVHPDNKRAKSLYSSLGFQEHAYEENYYGEHEHRVVMRLPLG